MENALTKKYRLRAARLREPSAAQLIQAAELEELCELVEDLEVQLENQRLSGKAVRENMGMITKANEGLMETNKVLMDQVVELQAELDQLRGDAPDCPKED